MKKNLQRVLTLSAVALASHGLVNATPVDAFTARLDAINAMCGLYQQSIPFAESTIQETTAKIPAMKASAEMFVIGVTTDEEAAAQADALVLEPLETSLVQVLQENATTGVWELVNVARQNANQPAYLSSTYYDWDSEGWGGQYSTNFSTLWQFTGSAEDGYSTVGTADGLLMSCQSNFGVDKKIGPRGFYKQDVKLNFTVRDGYVVVTSKRTNDSSALLSITGDNRIIVANPESNEVFWKVRLVDEAETAEICLNQLGNWAAATPGGNEVVAPFEASLSDAATLADKAEVCRSARKALLESLAQYGNTDKALALYNSSKEGYLYKSGSWALAPGQSSATQWNIFTTNETGEHGGPMYLLYNVESDNFIDTDCGTTSDEGAAAKIEFMLVPNGSLVLIINNDYPIYFNNSLSYTYSKAYTASDINWEMSFAEEGGSEIDPVKLAECEKRLNEVRDLLALYQKSVEFADLSEISGLLEMIEPEYLYYYYDELDSFVQTSLIEPIEEAVLAALVENTGKKWNIYQPKQPGYLCATVKYTNQGYNSFNYQAVADANSAWTLEPGAEAGQYYLVSAKGQYIGTPRKHYCQALDAKPEGNNGLFTLAVKDGYVNFCSVEHPGYGLGLDCQSDPAEIMSLTDGSTGYRWQVSFANDNEAEVEKITELLEKAKALFNLYKESVPFAAEALAEFDFIFNVNPSQLVGMIDDLDAFYQDQIVAPIEETVLQALADNADKTWTLYQPVQPGYLCATLKYTNQGYSSFNFQAEANANAAWTLEPSAEAGKFYLVSAKGQYIGTPKKHYCQALDSKPEGNNGLFTFAVKDGYVNFCSVEHPGYGLGLDCQRDPAEIMSLTDGSNGYRWQVNIFVEPAVGVDVTVTPAAGEVAWDLLKEIRVSLNTTEEYTVAEDAANIEMTCGGKPFATFTPAEILAGYDAETGEYILRPTMYDKADYALIIPEGVFKGEKVYNNAVTINWKATDPVGIEEILINGEAAAEVYDLQGRLVANPVSGNIYVINGKKVMYRK